MAIAKTLLICAAIGVVLWLLVRKKAPALATDQPAAPTWGDAPSSAPTPQPAAAAWFEKKAPAAMLRQPKSGAGMWPSTAVVPPAFGAMSTPSPTSNPPASSVWNKPHAGGLFS